MSLLLEALKKAELAKQGALGNSQPAEEPELGGIRFEEPSEPTLRPESPKYRTDFDSAPEPVAPPVPVPEPVAAVPPPPRPAPPPEPDVVSPSRPNPQRDAARQMFEAKEVDYNPKRPFYITLGVLGLAAVGYGVYLWWQLQPRYSVNTASIQNAPKSAPISKPLPPPPPATEDQPGASATPPAEVKPETQAPAAVPGAAPSPAAQTAATPAPAAVAPSKAAPAAKPEAQPPAPVQQRAAKPPAPAAAPATGAPPSTQAVAAPRAPRLPIKVTPPAFQGNSMLESAYAAFQRGDLERARSDYQQVLAREANNRDALLGLAAIDVRTRDFETAELRYLKLIELDPRDTHAQAALIALQGNVDPVQLESRIKNTLATQPDATHLYFTLGNQYSAQARWGEAQEAYFKAYSADPENADFAFNLAVSLDHLRQRRLAAEYYRKALALAGTRAVGFDRRQAETRAQELER